MCVRSMYRAIGGLRCGMHGGRITVRGAVSVFVCALSLAAASRAAERPSSPAWLGERRLVAPGIEFYRVSDDSLLSPPGAVAVQLLRVDLERAELRLMLAQDAVVGSETVPDMARRAGAAAAINGGFFLPTGEPAGLMKVDGEVVSEITPQRGARSSTR